MLLTVKICNCAFSVMSDSMASFMHIMQQLWMLCYRSSSDRHCWHLYSILLVCIFMCWFSLYPRLNVPGQSVQSYSISPVCLAMHRINICHITVLAFVVSLLHMLSCVTSGWNPDWMLCLVFPICSHMWCFRPECPVNADVFSDVKNTQMLGHTAWISEVFLL